MIRDLRFMFSCLIYGSGLLMFVLICSVWHSGKMYLNSEGSIYYRPVRSPKFINKTFNILTQGGTKNNIVYKQEKSSAFKFFIYDIPTEFNDDLLNCVFHQQFMCVDFRDSGMGPEIAQMDQNKNMSFRDTTQYSLGVVIHNKLKTNRLRTMNPDEADLFYIPVYFVLKQFCNNNDSLTRKQMTYMRDFIEKSPYWRKGTLHFSVLDIIYLWMDRTFFLSEDIMRNTIFITMERIDTQRHKALVHEIVSPYPSYGHFLPGKENVLSTNLLSSRNIYILLPVGKRRACSSREILKQQFQIRTDLPYSSFMTHQKDRKFDKMMYFTNECSTNSTRDTLPWLQNAVFCLHPSGDSETRKSFYDSIISGCIPVIITKSPNPYPFQQLFDYDTFSVFIPFKDITEKNKSVSEILHNFSYSKVKLLQNNVRRIAQYFQYSMPNDEITEENDALQIIFTEISNRFNLPYDKKVLSI